MTTDISDIEQNIKDRLTAIDERLDALIAQKKAIGDEIRRLREERVPIARLARAAAPRTSKTRQPKTIQGVVAARPTEDSV